jgi:hypothetical protein
MKTINCYHVLFGKLTHILYIHFQSLKFCILCMRPMKEDQKAQPATQGACSAYTGSTGDRWDPTSALPAMRQVPIIIMSNWGCGNYDNSWDSGNNQVAIMIFYVLGDVAIIITHGIPAIRQVAIMIWALGDVAIIITHGIPAIRQLAIMIICNWGCGNYNMSWDYSNKAGGNNDYEHIGMWPQL